MSNVIKPNHDLQVLKDFVKKKEITSDDIEEMLKQILPKQNGKTLIGYNIQEFGDLPAYFCPLNEAIYIQTIALKNCVLENTKVFAEDYKIRDIIKLRNYIYLYALLHETEHSHQSLIANGTFKSSNSLIKNGYNEIFELAKIIPKDIKSKISTHLYNKNCQSYFIERNACIEAFDIVSQLALAESEEELYNLFIREKNDWIKIGYNKSTIGSLEETYKKILMYETYKKFDKNIECSEEERIRLGLNISKESRQKVLSLQGYK